MKMRGQRETTVGLKRLERGWTSSCLVWAHTATTKPRLVLPLPFLPLTPINHHLPGLRELLGLFSRGRWRDTTQLFMQHPAWKIITSPHVITFCCCLCFAAGKIPSPPWWGPNNDRMVERRAGARVSTVSPRLLLETTGACSHVTHM